MINNPPPRPHTASSSVSDKIKSISQEKSIKMKKFRDILTLFATNIQALPVERHKGYEPPSTKGGGCRPSIRKKCIYFRVRILWVKKYIVIYKRMKERKEHVKKSILNGQSARTRGGGI